MWGISWHRWYLAHVRSWPWGLLLRHCSSYQRGQSCSTLNEGVQSFLNTWVVKIDPWRSRGSLTLCNWHSDWWGVKTLWSSCRRARHGLTGWILGLGQANGAIGLRLWSNGHSGACWCTSTSVEKTKDFSLQLLLVARVSCSTWTNWKAKVAGLCVYRHVRRMGWRRKPRSCGWNVSMRRCRCLNVDSSCRIEASVRIAYCANYTTFSVWWPYMKEVAQYFAADALFCLSGMQWVHPVLPGLQTYWAKKPKKNNLHDDTFSTWQFL